MAIIKLEHINPGMIVANDVKDRSGRILIRANTEIIEKHFKILKTWGVRSIEIITADSKVEEELTINISPEQLSAAKDTVEMLFQHSNRDHPAIQELMTISTQRLAKKLGTKIHGN